MWVLKGELIHVCSSEVLYSEYMVFNVQAYVQQLETSRLKLAQLELQIQQTKQMVRFLIHYSVVYKSTFMTTWVCGPEPMDALWVCPHNWAHGVMA